MKPFEEIDPKLETDYLIVAMTERENTFNNIFKLISYLDIRTNSKGDYQLEAFFNSQSDKRELIDRTKYFLKIIIHPTTREILTIEHPTCPDYNLNRCQESDCSHIEFAKKILEMYK